MDPPLCPEQPKKNCHWTEIPAAKSIVKEIANALSKAGIFNPKQASAWHVLQYIGPPMPPLNRMVLLSLVVAMQLMAPRGTAGLSGSQIAGVVAVHSQALPPPGWQLQWFIFPQFHICSSIFRYVGHYHFQNRLAYMLVSDFQRHLSITIFMIWWESLWSVGHGHSSPASNGHVKTPCIAAGL